jgi:hypothetical protein
VFSTRDGILSAFCKDILVCDKRQASRLRLLHFYYPVAQGLQLLLPINVSRLIRVPMYVDLPYHVIPG